jgi:hypothetical protein
MTEDDQSFEYVDEDSKSERFVITEINTFEDLMKVKGQYDLKNFIYRGVNNWRFKMFSSFQREMIFNNQKYAEVFEKYKKEYLTLLSVKNITSIKYDGEELTHKLWFNIHLRVNSYLQHYYQLSPMLDFTSCFYVALYFAFKDAVSTTGYVSLIMLDSQKLTAEEEFTKNISFFEGSSYLDPNDFPDVLINYSNERERVFGYNQHLLEEIFRSSSEHVLFQSSLPLYNEKLKAQKGMFLFFKPHLESAKAKPFEDIYFQNNKEKITCLHINLDLKEKVESYLIENGITQDSLFLNKN